ncbi:MAG: hypothetical protein GSR78_01200 [Desulfurococcales archaeon]|nr:hypothetical protein [Desulfurococcales archaeon]
MRRLLKALTLVLILAASSILYNTLQDATTPNGNMGRDATGRSLPPATGESAPPASATQPTVGGEATGGAPGAWPGQSGPPQDKHANAAGLPEGFRLAASGPLVLLPGGSGTVSLGMEAFGGFNSSVSLEVVGFRYMARTSYYDWLAGWERFFSVDFSQETLRPEETVNVTVKVSSKPPPGGYGLVVKATSSEGLTSSTIIPVYVPGYPGYVIVPRPPEGPVEAVEPFTLEVDVIPVGPFNKTVKLSFRGQGPVEIIGVEGTEGRPPFTARVTLIVADARNECSGEGSCYRAYHDPWPGFGMPGGTGISNYATAMLYIQGNRGGSMAFVIFGTEAVPDRGSGILSLIRALFFPLELALSLIVGTTVGVVHLTAQPVVPFNSFLAAVEAGSLVLAQPLQDNAEAPSTGDYMGSHWLGAATVDKKGRYVSVLKVAVTSTTKKGSILASSSQSIGGVFLVNAVAPGEEGLRLEVYKASKRAGTATVTVLHEEPGRLVAIVSVEPALGEHVVKLISHDGRVLDAVKISSIDDTGERILIARPGEKAILYLPYHASEPLYSVEELQVKRHKPRLYGYGDGPIATYTTGYIIEYWYNKTVFKYKQGEEYVEDPEAGTKPATLVIEDYHVIPGRKASYIIVEITDTAPPGLYEVLGYPIIILIPENLDPETLQPLRVKILIEEE